MDDIQFANLKDQVRQEVKDEVADLLSAGANNLLEIEESVKDEVSDVVQQMWQSLRQNGLVPTPSSQVNSPQVTALLEGEKQVIRYFEQKMDQSQPRPLSIAKNAYEEIKQAWTGETLTQPQLSELDDQVTKDLVVGLVENQRRLEKVRQDGRESVIAEVQAELNRARQSNGLQPIQPAPTPAQQPSDDFALFEPDFQQELDLQMQRLVRNHLDTNLRRLADVIEEVERELPSLMRGLWPTLQEGGHVPAMGTPQSVQQTKELAETLTRYPIRTVQERGPDCMMSLSLLERNLAQVNVSLVPPAPEQEVPKLVVRGDNSLLLGFIANYQQLQSAYQNVNPRLEQSVRRELDNLLQMNVSGQSVPAQDTTAPPAQPLTQEEQVQGVLDRVLAREAKYASLLGVQTEVANYLQQRPDVNLSRQQQRDLASSVNDSIKPVHDAIVAALKAQVDQRIPAAVQAYSLPWIVPGSATSLGKQVWADANRKLGPGQGNLLANTLNATFHQPTHTTAIGQKIGERLDAMLQNRQGIQQNTGRSR